ncbi:hypothetical protein EYZ11_003059 [Aspergillus tanneri]|uniref:Uncharacterized protein n=1 Tax=Aspergillus tanneri TaxID=1220188 RepID=A0A4S3JTV9_9EURO|nr:hypothetical protein EYZ11_003059 [Aspergillus tanneri]
MVTGEADAHCAHAARFAWFCFATGFTYDGDLGLSVPRNIANQVLEIMPCLDYQETGN